MCISLEQLDICFGCYQFTNIGYLVSLGHILLATSKRHALRSEPRTSAHVTLHSHLREFSRLVNRSYVFVFFDTGIHEAGWEKDRLLNTGWLHFECSVPCTVTVAFDL